MGMLIEDRVEMNLWDHPQIGEKGMSSGPALALLPLLPPSLGKAACPGLRSDNPSPSGYCQNLGMGLDLEERSWKMRSYGSEVQPHFNIAGFLLSGTGSVLGALGRRFNPQRGTGGCGHSFVLVPIPCG